MIEDLQNRMKCICQEKNRNDLTSFYNELEEAKKSIARKGVKLS